MSEQEIAMRDAVLAAAEHGYFQVRPQIDSNDRRRVFEAGFVRCWDRVRPKHPLGLTENRIAEIANAMPGGIDGFCKGWGWVQFARAIEAEHGIGVEPDHEATTP